MARDPFARYCKECKYYSKIEGGFANHTSCTFQEINQFNGLVQYQGKLENNSKGECRNFKAAFSIADIAEKRVMAIGR